MNVTFFQWMPSRVCAAPTMVRFSTCTLSAKMRDGGGSRISALEGMLVASRRLPPSDAGLSTAPMARIRGAPTKTCLAATFGADLELPADEALLADLELLVAEADEEFAAALELPADEGLLADPELVADEELLAGSELPAGAELDDAAGG